MRLATVFCVIAVFSVLTFIVLFGQLPALQHTIVSRARRALLKGPALLSRLDRQWLDGQAARMARKAWRACEHPLKWTIPAVYCTIVAVCLFVFFTHCMPKLHPRHRPFILLISPLPHLTTILCIFSDPGRVTAHTHSRCLSRYAYDGILYADVGAMCRTCGLQKPARSKHCSTCGSCIALADHHCIWLNNCFGHNNYRWFLAFMAANCVFLVYGAYLTGTILYPKVAHVTSPKSWMLTIRESSSNRQTGCLFLLCLLLSPVVCGFLAEHLRYIYLGTTTNETAKWQSVHDSIRNKNLYAYAEPGLARAHTAPAVVLTKTHTHTFDRRLTQKEQSLVTQRRLVLMQIDSFHQLTNIYDKGFFRNLCDRLDLLGLG